MRGRTFTQADGGNSSDRLIERKQMSTKTTLKRVALVAVAALSFGVLTSVAPASAVASTYTSGSTLSATSLTVVSSTTGATKGGKFYLDVTGNVVKRRYGHWAYRVNPPREIRILL